MPRPATPHLSNRLRQLSLNSPPQTALFYARLYNSLCPLENDHESLHILALCLLEVGETYSSLHVVRDRADMGCSGCAMILARCCQKLGRFSEGQAALQRAMTRGAPLSESSYLNWRVAADDSSTHPRHPGFSSYSLPHVGEFITQGKSHCSRFRELQESITRRSMVLGGIHRTMRYRLVPPLLLVAC
jgi:hypothetical protein